MRKKSLFFLLVLNNMEVEEESKLQNWCDVLIRVQHKARKWNYYCLIFLIILYRSKQHLIMLYIYYVSVLRHLCVLIEQVGLKLGHKLIAVFNNLFALICSQPKGKQNRARDFLLFQYFLNNPLLTVSMQNTLSRVIVIKSEWLIFTEKRGRYLFRILLEMCVQSLKLIV